MAGWVCADCTTVYTVGAPRCPQCQSTDHAEQGELMPKITRHGGPTIAVGGIAVSGAWGDEPQTETAGADNEPPASSAPAPDDGGASSPGKSSSASSRTSEQSSEPSETDSPSPARKTASRSKKAQTGSSSAAGTDGDQADGTSASK